MIESGGRLRQMCEMPPLEVQLSPFNMDAGPFGEVAMILWLLVMGITATVA
jgi:hypothetical protein